MIKAVKKCLIEESKTLQNISDEINNSILPFIDKLCDCKGKRCFIGVGKSLMVAAKIASSFSSVGYPSIDMDTLRILHGDLGFLTEDDLVIAISNSGETDILLSALRCIANNKIDIISITGNNQSSVAQMSSSHILIKTKEAGAFGIIPSSSTTAVMALGDALLCGMIERDKIDLERFIKHHPEGELSKHS